GSERTILLAAGAGELRDLRQVILRLIAIALFDLPQAVILPGLDVVGVGLQRALVPDLRELVVAELAVGVADQIGDRRGVVVAERLELIDRARIVVAVVDRGVGGAIAVGELRIFLARTGIARFFLLAGLGRGRRRVVVGRCINAGDDGCADKGQREHRQSEQPDRGFTHACLLCESISYSMWND